MVDCTIDAGYTGNNLKIVTTPGIAPAPAVQTLAWTSSDKQ